MKDFGSFGSLSIHGRKIGIFGLSYTREDKKATFPTRPICARESLKKSVFTVGQHAGAREAKSEFSESPIRARVKVTKVTVPHARQKVEFLESLHRARETISALPVRMVLRRSKS